MPQIFFTESVRVGEAGLPGDLVVPEGAAGLILFVHASASSRSNPRHQSVASMLQRRHLGTLLFDLLTQEEARDASKAVDMNLLTQRTTQALEWVDSLPQLRRCPRGLFGASTAAAAALVAAAQSPDKVMAVVSRGGRPDLASAWLAKVKAPTLLIVGGADPQILDGNRAAMRYLTAPKRLEVVPDAGHLFEEPGALSTVGAFAVEWFQTHLISKPLH